MKRKTLSLLLVLVIILGIIFANTLSVNAKTVTGPGGVARLDYMYSSPGYFTWSVIPDTLWAYVFTGTISWSTESSSGSESLFGFGALGSTLGGTFESYTYRTGYGTAYFSGTATDQWGDDFVVMPGFDLPFFSGTPLRRIAQNSNISDSNDVVVIESDASN
jgi:hypothetical protein